MVTEVESSRSQRQLEDALHRVDLRLESVSAMAAQCSTGLSEAKAFAQGIAERLRAEALREAQLTKEATEQVKAGVLHGFWAAFGAVSRLLRPKRAAGAGGAEVLRAAGEVGGCATARRRAAAAHGVALRATERPIWGLKRPLL